MMCIVYVIVLITASILKNLLPSLAIVLPFIHHALTRSQVPFPIYLHMLLVCLQTLQEFVDNVLKCCFMLFISLQQTLTFPTSLLHLLIRYWIDFFFLVMIS